MWLMLWLLTACQDPFPEGRRDLLSFRIVGVSASAVTMNGQEFIAARALIAGDSGLFHPFAPKLEWEICGAAATGAAPVMPVQGWPCEIRLVATEQDGTEQDGTGREEAVMSLESAPALPEMTKIQREATNLTMQDALLAPESRRQEGADAPVTPGGAVELTALLTGSADTEAYTSRWMATGGTLRELDRHATDWFAGTLTIDDEEIASSSAIHAGIWTAVDLVIDGQGGNAWRVVDMGVDAGPALASADRLLPLDAAAGGAGSFLATFTATGADAGGPGFLLSDLEPITDLSGVPAICGQAAGVAFDPDWLAEGDCGTAELDGLRVLVEGAPWP